jgi:hypothetical protein
MLNASHLATQNMSTTMHIRVLAGILHLILPHSAQCLDKYHQKVKQNILIYIQQDATLHILFYLETALNISGGNTTHHQECKQLYLQHLVLVTPLLLYAAIVEELEQVLMCCGWCTTPPTAH